MARPCKRRRICDYETGIFFKFRCIPLRKSNVINLQLDELEALRLADVLGMTQEEGAEAMEVSRSTFGRILESAHRKTARALVEKCALKIEGGPVTMRSRNFQCRDCGHSWSEPFGSGRPQNCPECKSNNIFRTNPGPSYGGGGNRGRAGGGRGRNRGGGGWEN